MILTVVMRIVGPLAMGGFLYAAARPGTIAGHLLNTFLLPKCFHATVVWPLSGLASLIVYSLPDGLWMYSLLCSLLLIWGNDLHSGVARVVLAMAVAGPLAHEFAQGILPALGTFDMMDVSMYLGGAAAALLPQACIFRRQEAIT